jgi:hypothetical protein
MSFESLDDPTEWPELYPPPRDVPASVRTYLLAAGGVRGAALFLLGSLLWLPPVVDRRWRDDARLDAGAREASGTLIDTQQTPLFGGRRPITLNRYAYRFTLSDREVTGVSYDVRRIGTQGPGSSLRLTVEYDPADPECNRIANTYAGLFEPWLIVRVPAFLVSLLGLALMARGMRRGLRTTRLLTHGEIAPIDSIVKLRAPDGSPLSRREVSAWAPVLFDPSQPGLGLSVRRLGGVRLTADGQWQGELRMAATLMGLLVFLLLMSGPLLVAAFMWYAR